MENFLLQWYDLGKIVVPLTSKGDGCPNDGKSTCIKEWQKTTLEQTKKYLENSKFKNHNWGILTGEVNSIEIVDLDVAKENQLSGVEYLSNFIRKNGIDCKHIVMTGSGGYHLYFKWDR